MDYDFFDSEGKRKYIQLLDVQNKKRDLTIKTAFQELQKTKQPIATALNEIDNYTTEKLTKAGIPAEGWHVYTIAERLNLPRNPMLHGESHSFYSIGSYILMLYVLFQLYEENQTADLS